MLNVALLMAKSKTLSIHVHTHPSSTRLRSSNALETKGLVVSGELYAFGERFRPTWTRLATQAAAGSSTLQLMEEVMGDGDPMTIHVMAQLDPVRS